MELLRTLDAIATEQRGLVTRRQAATAGISAAAWYRAIDAGLLEALHPNVARTYGSPRTYEQRVLAALMCVGTVGAASHRSAAHLWGIPRSEPDDDPVEIVMTKRQRYHRLDGVTVHRPRDLRDLVPVHRDGIRTTNILRTLCDLGAVEAESVPGAVGHVITTKLATPAALHRAVRTHGRRGRPGVPALRAALDEWVIDGKPADSVLEPAMRDLLRRHRLPAVDFHARLGRYEVDFLVTGGCVVLECDGWGIHALDKRTWEADKVRDADLASDGYVTVRFTYRQITRHGPRLAERIRAVIQRWSPHVLVTSALARA